MNPSSKGWIDKFFRDLKDHNTNLLELSFEKLYDDLKSVGFIYGTSIDTLLPDHPDLLYSREEQTKLNLFTALLITYFRTVKNPTEEHFITTLTAFYNELDSTKSWLSVIMNVKTGKNERLEKIIHSRVQTNESVFRKNFSNLINNALLYIDVLAFKSFLKLKKDPIHYASNLEAAITNIIFLALDAKQEKDNHDELLVQFFAASVRYTDVSSAKTMSLDTLALHDITDVLEKRYILDLISIAIWRDQKLDKGELDFIHLFGNKLGFEKKQVQYSVNAVHKFINDHKQNIPFFNFSHPAQHFYNHTLRTVRLIILRNKKRLTKEIMESKDLMILLSQSASRELSKEEKQKVKKQLLDICKTIPSLAIFILPGGSVLLPFLVKFIPQLLPSAFNENK